MGPISTNVSTSVVNSSITAPVIEGGLNYVPGVENVVDSVKSAFLNVKSEEIVGIAFLGGLALSVLTLSAFVIFKLVKCCRKDPSQVEGKAVTDPIKELKKENARLLKENAELSSRVKSLEGKEIKMEEADDASAEGHSKDGMAKKADNAQVASDKLAAEKVVSAQVAAKKVEFEVLQKEIEATTLISVKYEDIVDGKIIAVIAEIPENALTDKGGKNNKNPLAYDEDGLPIMLEGADDKDHSQHILLDVVKEFNNKKAQLDILQDELEKLETNLSQL